MACRWDGAERAKIINRLYINVFLADVAGESLGTGYDEERGVALHCLSEVA
jgi:hypothetical protein